MADVPSLEEVERWARAGEIPARLAGWDEPSRRALARELVPRVRKLDMFGDESDLIDLLRPACLATATLAELRRLGWRALPFRSDDPGLHEVLVARRPEWLAEWVDWALGERPWLFDLARAFVREDVIARPDSEAYILGLVAVSGHGDRDLHAMLTGDPDLLEHEVWRLFEVEGGGDVSLAAFDKYTHDEESGWTATLLRLGREDILDRDRLLDASLDALNRDFSSFRAGWFSRFHEAAEPTLDERAARTERYGGLVASPIANTVSFALKSLAVLDKAGRLEAGDELVAQLGVAATSERKATVKTTLRLLSGVRKRDPALAVPVALAACEVLGHPDADLQQAALKVVEPQAGDTVVRARLLELAGAVAPTVRSRFAELAGEEEHQAPATVPDLGELTDRARTLDPEARRLAGVDVALAAPGPPVRMSIPLPGVPVLRGRALLEPVESVDELVGLAGRVVEGDTHPDGIERLLDGISRLGLQRPESFEAQTSSVRRRLRQVESVGLRVALGSWVGWDALEGDRLRESSSRWPKSTLRRRGMEVARRITEGVALPLLAFPTHEGGWIETGAFADRLASHEAIGQAPGRADLLQALTRLVPGTVGDVLATIEPHLGEDPVMHVGRALAEDPGVAPAIGIEAVALYGSRLLRVTSTAVPGEFEAALPGLFPDPDTNTVLRSWVSLELGDDDGPELARLWPAGHDALWGHACDWLAYGTDTPVQSALLEPALDPDRPLGPLGATAVALGLMAFDRAGRAEAVDAAIVAIADGRLDVELLGNAGRWLMAETDVAQPGRLAAALREVADESALHAEVVRLAAQRMVALDAAPHGLHAVLDLLNELSAAAGAGISDEGAHAFLASRKGSSKVAKLAKALLARDGEGTLGPQAAALAAEGRIVRAERWSGWSS